MGTSGSSVCPSRRVMDIIYLHSKFYFLKDSYRNRRRQQIYRLCHRNFTYFVLFTEVTITKVTYFKMETINPQNTIILYYVIIVCLQSLIFSEEHCFVTEHGKVTVT
jgi:hypothetical protein